MPVRKLTVAFFFVAILVYLPGIWWGIPRANLPDRHLPWGADELGPLGPLAEFYSVFVAPEPKYFNPQYLLTPYAIQSVTVAPYVAFQVMTGGMKRPSAQYPYGLADPETSIRTMSILGRVMSLLMAAGTVAVAFRTGVLLWSLPAGIFAGLFVLLQYPMFYYGRTSNVDTTGLFWMGLGTAVVITCLKEGLTVRRGVWLGIFTALATTTKDAYLPYFAIAGLIVAVMHLRRWRASANGTTSFWKPLLAAFLPAAGLYLLASGILFHAGRYWYHLDFISHATAMFTYPRTLSGLIALTWETGGHILDSMGWPMVILTLAGIVICARKTPQNLLLLLPALGIFAVTILPVFFVNLRYIMPITYVLALFAAYALSEMKLRARHAFPVVLTLVCGWQLARAADLTYLMLNDSRLQSAEWLRHNARPGDRLGYYAISQKLPRVGSELLFAPAPRTAAEASDPKQAPEFILIIPQQHFEDEYEWDIPGSVYQALRDGSWGYELVHTSKTVPLFGKCTIPFVNPGVKVFARRDVARSRALLVSVRQNGGD